MAEHVAILLPRYIGLILDGVKTVESRLTITARPPFRAIAPGDKIHFKASGGPYMATAVAEGVAFFDNLTPRKIVELQHRFNDAVQGEAAYWHAKRHSRFATFITLRDVRPSSFKPDLAPSQGIAWFVLETKAQPFDVPVTRSAFTTRVVRIPPKVHRFDDAVYGGTTAAQAGEPLTLLLPDGTAIQTDVVRKDHKFRWRGWHEHLTRAGIAVGDTIRFDPQAKQPRHYRVSFIRNAAHASHALASHAETRPERNDRTPTSPDAPSGGGRPALERFTSRREIFTLIQLARREDLGPQGDDVTSRLLVPRSLRTSAVMHARAAGRLCGAALLEAVAAAYDKKIGVAIHKRDGDALAPRDTIATFTGPLRSVLAMERVALNFVTHLSGIASLTARYVEAVLGTRAGIYDTRKTIPGLRGLAKYAVACGGGKNHRIGLYDAVLVKDNHIAHLSLDALPAALEKMIRTARRQRVGPAFIEVEVDTLAQLQRVLPLGPDLVLLDNMDPPTIAEAVAMRDRIAPRVELEASGGINLTNIRPYAEAGVDRIAIGALTHSAPALDVGLDIG